MKRLLLSGLFVLGARLLARAVEVSGAYENAGTAISTPLASTAGPVPLRGLVGLEFNLPLARTLYADTARFVITQTDSSFVLRCLDVDGVETWNGRWDRGIGYDLEERQVKLLFRAKRYGTDGFYFLLSPVSDGELLLVEVHRVKSTSFGPGTKPIGSFLFNRVAGAAPASSK